MWNIYTRKNIYNNFLQKNCEKDYSPFLNLACLIKYKKNLKLFKQTQYTCKNTRKIKIYKSTV